ncbi:MAG: hypothetical protein AW07_04032 [Candidatus Accumulibacter sp. SK-11]|nr:MAG: hypothetical protein AW07_04032 [Candidatus Accumulibacter sp. SK-11]
MKLVITTRFTEGSTSGFSTRTIFAACALRSAGASGAAALTGASATTRAVAKSSFLSRIFTAGLPAGGQGPAF